MWKMESIYCFGFQACGGRPPSAIQLRKCKVIELMKTRPCYGVKCNCTHIRSVETPGQDFSTSLHSWPTTKSPTRENLMSWSFALVSFCFRVLAERAMFSKSLRFVAQRWDGHLSCPAPSAPPRKSYKQITPARLSTWENLSENRKHFH